MISRDAEAVRTLHFHSFDRFELVHAVFTRHGGVSPEPWASLNLGGTVGDDFERVVENRRRAFTAAGRAPESMADLWQVHSRDVLRLDGGPPPKHVKADAIITNRPQHTLFLRFADCVPVLLYDPKRKAIGLVHSGWMGTVLKAASAAVEAMTESYGSKPADLIAAIGPSIGPDHYEVGTQVVDAVRDAFAQPDELLLPGNGNGRPHFDLWAANRRILLDAGVEQIETAGICTACHTQDFFSHRKEMGRTGRFAALLALRDE